VIAVTVVTAVTSVTVVTGNGGDSGTFVTGEIAFYLPDIRSGCWFVFQPGSEYVWNLPTNATTVDCILICHAAKYFRIRQQKQFKLTVFCSAAQRKCSEFANKIPNIFSAWLNKRQEFELLFVVESTKKIRCASKYSQL
jgi:hypothetical protein